MDWLSPEMWVGFGIGVGLVLAILAFDWIKDDYVKPYLAEKRRRRIMEQSEKKIREERSEAGMPTPDRMLRAEKSTSSPPSSSLMAPSARPVDDDGIATQEHPAPSTAMIDVTKPPPPLPSQKWQPPEKIGGYMSSGEPITEMPRVPSGPAPGGARPRATGPTTGPAFDRRKLDDPGYTGPERRHRSDQPRMTRAEARRLREQEESPSPGQNPE